MTESADLSAYLFDGQPHRLAGELLDWMDTSSRFLAFADTYRDKIRKKLRVNRDPESLLDVRAELAVAYGLLTDRRFAVAYEPAASEKRRSPDFAITYRANLVFLVEVARMRVDDRKADLAYLEDRITRILLGKLSQLQPGQANLLVIHCLAAIAQQTNLEGLLQQIKTRVEGRDPAFYALSRYSSPADFYKDFTHLSGIVLWGSGPQLWVNKQARPALDEKIMRQVAYSLSGA
jgi:hypothetical protein